MYSRFLSPIIFLLGLSLNGPLQGKGAVAFETVLPEDTVALLAVNDLSQLYATAEVKGSPLAISKDPQVQRFFAPLLERIQTAGQGSVMLKELGLELEDLKRAFPERAWLAFSGLSGSFAEKSLDTQTLLLADYQGDPKVFEQLITYQPKPAAGSDPQTETVLKQEEYEGETLYIQQISSDVPGSAPLSVASALVDGTSVVAGYPVEHVKAMLSRLKAKRDRGSSLASQPNFEKIHERFDSLDSLFYLNLQPLSALARKAVMESQSKAKANPFLSPIGLFDALNAENLEAFFVGKNFSDKQVMSDVGLFFNGRRGLVGLLTSYSGAAIEYPGFVTPQAFSSSVNRFDADEFYGHIETLFSDASPVLAGLYRGYLNQLKKSAGIDLQRDLIANLDDAFIQFSSLGSGVALTGRKGLPGFEQLSHAYIFSIENRPAFEAALETLKTQLGIRGSMIDRREYLGTTIHTIKNESAAPNGPKAPGRRLSYAVTDQYLFVVFGSPGVLEDTLARAAKSSPSLWQNPAIQKALDEDYFRPNAVAVSYSDLGLLLNAAFSALAQAQSLAGNKVVRICDPNALPKLSAFPFFMVGKAYLENKGLFAQYLLLKKPKAQ